VLAGKSTLTDSLVAAAGIIAMDTVRAPFARAVLQAPEHWKALGPNTQRAAGLQLPAAVLGCYAADA